VPKSLDLDAFLLDKELFVLAISSGVHGVKNNELLIVLFVSSFLYSEIGFTGEIVLAIFAPILTKCLFSSFAISVADDKILPVSVFNSSEAPFYYSNIGKFIHCFPCFNTIVFVFLQHFVVIIAFGLINSSI